MFVFVACRRLVLLTAKTTGPCRTIYACDDPGDRRATNGPQDTPAANRNQQTSAGPLDPNIPGTRTATVADVTRQRHLTGFILMGALAFAACGGSDDSTTSNTELRSAEEVRSEEAADGAQGELGSEVEVDGRAVSVSDPVLSGDDGGPWIEVQVRYENRGGTDIDWFEVGIVCTGNDEVGGYQAGSTLDLIAGLPAGTFDEGTVNLLAPGDGRFGEERPECTKPALVRVSAYIGGIESDEPSVFPLPADVIDQLNAAPQATS